MCLSVEASCVCRVVMDSLGVRDIVATELRKNRLPLLRTRNIPVVSVARIILSCQTYITTGAAALDDEDERVRRLNTRELARSVHAFLRAHCVPADPGQIVEYDGDAVHYSKLFAVFSHFLAPGHIHSTDLDRNEDAHGW